MAIQVDSKVSVLLKQIQQLDDVPRKFPVQGLLKSIADRILPYNIFVDKWPDYEVIVTKPEEEQINKLPAYRLGIYSRNAEALGNVLCQPGFLPNNVPIRVFGLPMDLVPALKKAAIHLGSHKLQLIREDDVRHFSSLTVADISPHKEKFENLDKTLSKDFYLSSIDPEKYGPKIALMWRYWNEFYESEQECIDVTKYYMKSGDTLGVYRRKDDKLISWIISNIDKSNMFGHTLDDYRRQSLLLWNSRKAAQYRFDRGEVFWGYVAEKNPIVMEILQEKMGAKMHMDLKAVHCVIRPALSKI